MSIGGSSEYEYQPRGHLIAKDSLRLSQTCEERKTVPKDKENPPERMCKNLNMKMHLRHTGGQEQCQCLLDKITFLPIFSILVVVTFVLGNFANGFIALVNSIEWVNRQKISSADQILTALAVSRVGLLWVILLLWYATVLNPDSYSLAVRITTTNAWAVTNHFSIWVATSLGIFYLLKIANFSNFIFLHLKRRIKSIIPVILLRSLLFLVCHLVVVNMDGSMWTKEYDGNVSWEIKLSDSTHLSDMTVTTLANLIPLILSLISFLLLICSLSKHLKKMQLHGKGSPDPNTEVHIKTLQTVISFLLLLAIYFLSLITSIWNLRRRLQKEPVLLLCQTTAIIYPSFHSFTLIWGSKKLKQTFLLILCQSRC
ncbi:taste receptor type 2 member 19-like [Theropithecus gelada]|uniref:taste receptor type 2 member 19-like n=1 Tax=Theropithecus gelada TaxID=9565 RepID=UPI000DC179C4|nr:taste receptor type 2 member 19-like [Theropithecus gelada]